MHILKLARLALIITTVSGCALQITGEPITDNSVSHYHWQQHQKKLKQLKRFKAAGSIAFFDNKTRNYARFYLERRSMHDYKLILTSPFGQPYMILAVNQHNAILTLSKNERYFGHDAEKLLKNVVGIDIPLTLLHKWIIGLSTNITTDRITDRGYLKKTAVVQKNNDKWSLTISDYHNEMAIVLPAKMALRYKDKQIRIAINEWIL